VVEIAEVDDPEPADDGVVVRVRASSVNKAEWYSLTGTPWIARLGTGITRPKSPRFGVDFSGTVETVGSDVTDFAPGDEVYGGVNGAFAELVAVKESIARKPSNMSFEEAAALPTAAITALQAVRDKGRLQAGQKVLVNGASGGVGPFAVQIAKDLGGEVTAVCSTHNVEMVASLGADRVVDYRAEDFTTLGDRFDVMVDVAGSRRWSELDRILSPEATVVMVGAPTGGPVLGPLPHLARTRIAGVRGRRRIAFFIAQFNRPDFETLVEMAERGALRSVIDRTYSLDDIADALAYVGEGHARAKAVVSV
jgi:NADPH:quinone reductase-like Zn-dependent oxidoreductase